MRSGRMKMKLLTKQVIDLLPPLGATKSVPVKEKIFKIKYSHLRWGWEWYPVELDIEDGIFFGFVRGFENQWGYFSIHELFKVGAERDMCFEPVKASEIIVLGEITVS